MRTNIVIDNDLIGEAMELTGVRTKREIVELALRNLVRLQRQRAVLALEGAITWEGDLETSRAGRILAEAETDYNAGSG